MSSISATFRRTESMYKDYFGFKEEPFSIAPDPQFLYMSERHREALAHLIYGMKADSGFVLLTGEVGTGKTTVCRCLLGQIPEDSEIAFILNPKLSVIELLATICDELSIDYGPEQMTVKALVDLINRFLLDAHSHGRQTVLIIDEAQNLSTDVLEQIRLLTNLETDKHKLLQVIMLGQPELNRILERPELRQLAQRVTARYHLEPLQRAELPGYLQHRLAVAGVERPLFPGKAVNRLFSLTGGVPRLINLLCDRALLGAYVKGQSEISPELLKEAASEVFGKQATTRTSGNLLQWVSVVLLSLILIVGTIFVGAFLRLSPQEPAPQIVHEAETKAIAVKPDVKSEPLAWNSDEPIDKSGLLAYQQLFRLWGYDQLDLSKGAGNSAAELGLELVNRQASLGRIRQLNRPAVLKINDPKGSFYVTLTGLDDESATVVIAGAVRKVAISQLQEQWFGDYGLMWQPPPGYHGSVRAGDDGTIVRWLDEQMAAMFGREAAGASVRLEGRLLEEIQTFQKRVGVEVDGVVGRHTLILLNSQIDDGHPTLHQ